MSGKLLAHGRPFHDHYSELPRIPASEGHFENDAVAQCSCGRRFVSQVRITLHGTESASWHPLRPTRLRWWRRDTP